MKLVHRLRPSPLLLAGLLAVPSAAFAAETPPLPPLPPDPPPVQRRTNRVTFVRPQSNFVTVRTNLPTAAPPIPSAPAFRPAQRSPLPPNRPPPLLARPPEQLPPLTLPPSDPTVVPGLVPAPAHNPAVAVVPAPGTVPNIRAAVVTPPKQETVLAWDGLVKEETLKPGATSGHFTFSFTNTAPEEVVIHFVRTSCGCTTAKLPPLPWRIPPGGTGSFDVELDARGKSGVVTKTVTVESSAGYRYLTVRVALPAAGGSVMAAADRSRNLQIALADRQAVLKGDCAVCHVTPGIGKMGAELYTAVCGVCHEAEHRASMVPNLRALSRPLSADQWRSIIRSGKADSLMPAFAASENGFMTDAQIESLVQYLTGPFRTSAPPGAVPSAPRPVLPTE
jgi:mono/diheme cytochrome c family protein